MKGKSYYFWKCVNTKKCKGDNLRTRKSGQKKCRKCGEPMERA